MRYGTAWCDGVHRKKVRTFVFITGGITITIPDQLPAREVDRLRADTELVPEVSVDYLASAEVGVAALMGILASLIKIGKAANLFIPPLVHAKEAREAGCKVAQALYLQWLNHYLTRASFCGHAGIPESWFDTLMDHCKQCHEFLINGLHYKETSCATPQKLPTLQ